MIVGFEVNLAFRVGSVEDGPISVVRIGLLPALRMRLAGQALRGCVVNEGARLRSSWPRHRYLREMVQQVVGVARRVIRPASRVGLVHLLDIAKYVVGVLFPFSRRIGDRSGV